MEDRVERARRLMNQRKEQKAKEETDKEKAEIYILKNAPNPEERE